MATYKELLAQKATLDTQLETLREQERDNVIVEIRQMMIDYHITIEDIVGVTRGKKANSVGKPKYRDPLSGATWTGRGKPPKWIQSSPDRDAFLIS
jgi:DNA-binding protein H-NS